MHFEATNMIILLRETLFLKYNGSYTIKIISEKLEKNLKKCEC